MWRFSGFSLLVSRLIVVPLQSDLGRVLESPLRYCVNSGVFGRAKRFVNQCLMRSLDLQPGVLARCKRP